MIAAIDVLSAVLSSAGAGSRFPLIESGCLVPPPYHTIDRKILLNSAWEKFNARDHRGYGTSFGVVKAWHPKSSCLLEYSL